MKITKNLLKITLAGIVVLQLNACKIPSVISPNADANTPQKYALRVDSINSATINWKNFFKDTFLVNLIDTALHNNQELKIVSQEIEIMRNEARAKSGEYLPFARFRAGSGFEKPGRYTLMGATEHTVEAEPGKALPEPLTDIGLMADISWEVDVWHKLRNAQKSTYKRFLASQEGRNFMITNLIGEIANAYYELLALDNQMEIVNQNITIQENALEIVKLLKQSAQTTELAVKKFEAEVLKNKSLRYNIAQKIVETENYINFLVGRFPQPVLRNSEQFNELTPRKVYAGIPSDLLANRPDIREAELDLQANKLDVQVARANFYPSFSITSGIGFQAFNAGYLVKAPESMLYNLAGDMVAPLINRRAIIAEYKNANARQIQSVVAYQQKILNGYVEVSNKVSKIQNLENQFTLKQLQVNALTESINIANSLFASARADYMEVLLTQRDALEARVELVETKKEQLLATVDLYRALGGGWR
ncbi:MAG: efflux transporter outer membrane subunit [Flavobacteriales bacterium]|nr:efflux transporter outer membrane subunit [Flavobacteriales bacterium]